MKYEMKLGSLRAEADTHGGELVSFCDGGGTEYIWNGTDLPAAVNLSWMTGEKTM